MRQLLTLEQESVSWPESLSRAVGTRGFTQEVQALIGRAREKGLEPADLARLARDEDRPDWLAAANFLEQYLTILDSASALDYPELIFRAVLLAESPARKAELRARFTPCVRR